METYDPSEHFVHVHGIPWELDTEAARAVLCPMLPTGAHVIETMLPLDKRARTTSRVYLRLNIDGAQSASDIVEALQNRTIGTRWLEARLSTASEYAFQKRQAAAITERVAGRARRAQQAYCRPAQAARPQLPTDPRDFVLLCHGTSRRIGAGQIDLNNLPNGRLDVLARCVAASLFVSYGVRRSTRIWLLLRDVGLTICVDGARVKGLHPDERTLAAAIRQTLLSGQSEQAPPPIGWALYGTIGSHEDAMPPRSGREPAAQDETVVSRLAAIVGGAEGNGAAGCGSGAAGADGSERVHLVVLDEQGAPFAKLVAAEQESCREWQTQPPPDAEQSVGSAGRTRTVVVVGDHVGFADEEQDAIRTLGAVPASLGPVPLLASHCIVLAHAALDAPQSL